jgi:DNA-binding NarL/FixJ family response regulator
MASGLTNSGIAGELVVTEKAVERHVTSIFSKLVIDAAPNEHRRVLAVLRFLQSAA